MKIRKPKTEVSEQIEQFLADHDGYVTVTEIATYYGIREDFARRCARELGAKKIGYNIVFDLGEALELARMVRETTATVLKPRNVDEALRAREAYSTPLLHAGANGRGATLVDLREGSADRYQLRLGKWGVYIRDTLLGQDLALPDVLVVLNRAAERESRDKEFFSASGEDVSCLQC